MIRLEDWPSRLDAYLRANEKRRFHYGRWDCCIFVRGAVAAMTGVDPAAGMFRKYSGRNDARQAIRQATGTASLRVAVAYVVMAAGMSEVPIRRAQRGDVVLFARGCERDHFVDDSLALVSLNGRDALAVGPEGFIHVPLNRALRAWHV